MKRLIKKSNETFKYETTSPIYINTMCLDDSIDHCYLHQNDEYYGALLDTINEYGTDILQYFDENNELQKVLTKMNITVGNDGYAHVKIDSTRELTQNEQDEILSYITGQFSDGWGEGFEQQDIFEYKVDVEYEEFDEEEQEYYTEIVEEPAYVNAHFYTSNNWNITIKRI